MIMDKIRIVNRMKIRMKRRKISTRLFQIVIVTVVLTLFLYLIFQAGLMRPPTPLPDFSWLSTRNVSVFLRPNRSTSLLHPSPSPCAGSPVLRLLVGVFSAPANQEARAVIRRTWAASLSKYPGVKVLFMLGRADQPQIQTSLERESAEFNDIILEDFHDTYLNLTLKTTFLLKWISTECTNAKFVFKVDDDVFVNTERLWQTLESSHLFSSLLSHPSDPSGPPLNVDYLLLGHLMQGTPIRDPASKWYLPPTFYPLNIFPAFLSGTGYILTGSLVPSLYSCALRTPFINLEDVFLTGLCATTQLGLRITHNKDFVWRPMAVGGTHLCYYQKSVTVHGVSPSLMEDVWGRTKDSLLCDTMLFSAMTGVSRVLEFLRNIFRI